MPPRLSCWRAMARHHLCAMMPRFATHARCGRRMRDMPFLSTVKIWRHAMLKNACSLSTLCFCRDSPYAAHRARAIVTRCCRHAYAFRCLPLSARSMRAMTSLMRARMAARFYALRGALYGRLKISPPTDSLYAARRLMPTTPAAVACSPAAPVICSACRLSSSRAYA